MSTQTVDLKTRRGNRRQNETSSSGGRSELRTAMVFIAPALIGFLVFYVYPMIRGFYFSMTQYNVLGTPKWIGFDNFVRIGKDPLFWNALWVTLEYVILNIGFQTIIAIVLAVMMQRLTKSTLLRGALLLPWLISNVIAAMTWFWLLDYQIGLVNQILEWMGANKIAFFGDSAWAIPTIAFVNVWRHMGYTALLVFAGLQTIPKYVYEAASIDGSSEWSSFWRITIPLLRPVLAMILVITVTGSFQVFDTVAVTTRGGPVNVTRVLQYYIYQKGFAEGQFGYASAISVILFLILGLMAAIQLRLLRAGESDLG
ncbi:MAG TPA: sugar ABC transporter permease [Propionicimonas sp.]